MSILPPLKYTGSRVPLSLRLPKDLLAEIDAISKDSGYSRLDVIRLFLTWAVEAYRAEVKEQPQK